MTPNGTHATPAAGETATARLAARIEGGVLTTVLAAMVALPLAELALRATTRSGIYGASALVQHLGLAAAMVGAMVAARERRLLALSAVPTLLSGRAAAAARFFANVVAAAVCIVLSAAAAQFVAAERPAGKLLTYGVPEWWAQLAMPIGFAVIAWRLLRQSAHGWRGVAAAAAFCAATLTLAAVAPAPRALVIPGFVALGAATVLGAPVFVAVGGAALLAFWGAGEPAAALAVDHYRVVVNPTLPAIPLFTLAGYFLAEAGAPTRLVRLFKALFAPFRGGGAIAAVVASSVLTCLTGASGVTILALGGLLLPFLVSLRYSERAALGLVTGAGLPGILLLPSMPLILFAIVAEVGIREMFLAGLAPALVMLVLTAAWGIRQVPARAPDTAHADWSKVRRAAAAAKWDLALPLVALGALFGGFASPVEAAAITALYAFAVQTFVYRDLRLATDVPRVTQEAGLLVGGVLLILGVALGLSNYLVDAQVPDRLVQWLEQRVHSRWLFLLALNVCLLAVGCLLDIFSAIIVVAPLVVPIGRAFDVDPIHLGIILLANLELGYLTPPVGLNLFFASYRFGKPIGEVFRSVASLLPVQLGGVLLITYVPVLALGLPALFGPAPR